MAGSSSGGSLPARPPEELRRQIRIEEERAAEQEFNAQVALALDGVLVNLNDRDTEAVRRHLDEITGALQEDIEGGLETLFGGSVSKHTYVDGISDIDSLVILNRSELREKSPGEVLAYFGQQLRDKFPDLEVTTGDLAATVSFKDIDVQLLPALRIGRRLAISSPDGQSWSEINPRSFRRTLTKTNERCGYKVIPLIKILKSFNDSQPKASRLSGYHVEALATAAFTRYRGPLTISKMAEHFFASVPERIRTPMKDRTGQSLYVDEYLGPRDSPARRRISRDYERMHRTLLNATGARAVDRWRAAVVGD